MYQPPNQPPQYPPNQPQSEQYRQQPEWQQPQYPRQPDQYQQPPSYPYQQPQYTPPPPMVQPPMQQKKQSRKKLFAIGCGGLVALVILIAIIVAAASAGGNSNPNTASQATQPAQATQAVQPTQAPTTATTAPTQVPTPKPTAKPAPTFRTFSDGMFAVGKDIQPGTYRTRVGSTGCYYARLSAFDTNAIISNNNTDAPAVITILPTDTAFQSQSCGTWTTDLSQITSSKTSFGDGIYIVGTDITPGTYKNSGSTGCYYARLSAFDTNAIISNDNTDAVAIVTIAASDKGFQSQSCGTWTKQ